jgi:signal transduction histidine kinase
MQNRRHTSKRLNKKQEDLFTSYVLDYSLTNAIYESTNIPLVVLDKNLSILSTNKTFLKKFNLEAIETINRSLPSIEQGRLLPLKFSRTLKKAINEGLNIGGYILEYENFHGNRIYYKLNSQKISLADFKTDLFLLQYLDITEQAKTERNLTVISKLLDRAARELKNERTFLSKILDKIRIAIIYVDNNLTIKNCNKEASEFLKLKNKILTDFPLNKLKKSHYAIVDIIEKVVSTGVNIYSKTIAINFGKNGENDLGIKHYLISCICDKNNNKAIIGAFFQAQDITSLVLTRERLEMERKKLEELEDRKDKFISMASHELKNPITTISAYLQLLQKNPNLKNNAKTKKYVQKSINQVRKIVALINDLMDVSKIEEGKIIITKKRINLNSFLQRIAKQIATLNKDFDITVNRSAKIYISGDVDRLEQVFTNLLSNAVKFSREDKKILINFKKIGDFATISVKDFGIGIPKGEIDTVFKRFKRSSEASKRMIEGTGLGLYISKEIIKLHDGKIWAESSLHRGSTFFISLPLAN